ncbi:uncharacterized protein A4U43_C01F27510 [Asparagus officinalis]|uniref:Uncharacterized protein n=1 Tax=Asparagus officinalis TaxID=4686 RepID=A0A5P1FTF6_ASPOF|nr:uncharacterized protein A4U43_C01F27510 [Asparagus officinalis]
MRKKEGGSPGNWRIAGGENESVSHHPQRLRPWRIPLFELSIVDSDGHLVVGGLGFCSPGLIEYLRPPPPPLPDFSPLPLKRATSMPEISKKFQHAKVPVDATISEVIEEAGTEERRLRRFL